MNKKNQTLTNQLSDRLYARIVRNGMQPGDVLGTERQLAMDFGVAYGTMREAVGRLRGQGILSGRPRHGLIVERPAPFQQFERLLPLLAAEQSDLKQLLDFRVGVEMGALALAIGRAPAEVLDQMEQTLKPFARHQSSGNAVEADVYDIRFHTLLLDASGNEYLSSLHEVISRFFGRVRTELPVVADATSPRSAAEHRMLLKALRQGDRAAASDILWKHLSVYRNGS